MKVLWQVIERGEIIIRSGEERTTSRDATATFSDISSDTDSTITGFEADDQLFIGSGFTAVALGDDENLGGRVGNASTLEVFIQQGETGAVLSFEVDAFSGNAPGAADRFTTVTLEGVNADDITIDANGFLRVTPEAEALVA